MAFYSVNSIFFGSLKNASLNAFPQNLKNQNNLMKKLFLLVIAALAAGACSSPKYTYHFDHYDYNSGRKQVATASAEPVSASPVLISDENIASTSASISPVPTPITEEKQVDKQAIAQKIAALSKHERNELKKDIKSQLTKYSKLKKSPDHVGSVNATKEWDRDLKLAAIFGAVGLVLSLFSGVNSVFWVLAVIALVIGVVFLIKWLARQ
jgi:hypothetical protein